MSTSWADWNEDEDNDFLNYPVPSWITDMGTEGLDIEEIEFEEEKEGFYAIEEKEKKDKEGEKLMEKGKNTTEDKTVKGESSRTTEITEHERIYMTRNEEEMTFYISKLLKLDIMKSPEISRFLINNFHILADLLKAIKSEKEIESPPVDINYGHNIQHFVDFDLSQVRAKIGIPQIITKIETPYKIISRSNMEWVDSKMYPEKWGLKQKIELYLFREKFLNEYKTKAQKYELISDQSSSFDLVKTLYSLSQVSAESKTIYDFSKEIMRYELRRLCQQLVRGGETKFIKETTYRELSEKTSKAYWVLDLFECINRNILKTSNIYYKSQVEKSHSVKHKVNMDFIEGKRINTEYYGIGASITKIEIENSGLELLLYVSGTIVAYTFKGSDKMHIGRNEMLNCSLSIADNFFTLFLYRDLASTSLEREFIDYYEDLMWEDKKTREGLSSMYESSCLLFGDLHNESSKMPILDNLVESMKINMELTERLFGICNRADGKTCIRMSAIAKVFYIAETDPKKGLEKYTQRTNRDHDVLPRRIEKLRHLFRKQVIVSYIRKNSCVPELYNVDENLIAQLELMACGKKYNPNVINSLSNYKNVILGKMLEPGNEMNIQTRILDKACTKDNYSEKGNSEKEISYYINNSMKEVWDEPFVINRSDYKKEERTVKILDRKDPELKNMDKYMGVRLVEKEKEQKKAARFFGVGSFKLKLYLSNKMEMVKRAMKLLPGQMMTMSDDERREIMFNMAQKLNKDNTYSLFLDYSGHNTSQRPENTQFILEEIANMYGYKEGSPEWEEFISICYLFNTIHVYSEDTWSDQVYYSHRQLGAIEGWLGALWGIQSQLMLDDMFKELGVKDYIGTTYSDDSCGVFAMDEMNEFKLNTIIQEVQKYGREMGLLVKLSQTQVTNGRCSMLKEHYLHGRPIDMTIKRIFSISPNGGKQVYDELEEMKLIDSGYTSSCTRAETIYFQTVLKNMRVMRCAGSSIYKMIMQLVEKDTLDPRFVSSIGSFDILMKRAFHNVSKGYKFKIPSKRDVYINFLKFHTNNNEIKSLFLAFMYLPYTCYGYATTMMLDAYISGYSLSNVKRISYVWSMSTCLTKDHVGSLIQCSRLAISYVNNPFPLTGGRRDTSLIAKDKIGERLPFLVSLKSELYAYVQSMNSEKEVVFLNDLVKSFKNCFSSRIVGKFYEESSYSYYGEIISKIDNSTTIKMLLGGKTLNQIIQRARVMNYNLSIRKVANGRINNFSDLVHERDNCEKIIRSPATGETEPIKIKFIGIEEVPLMGNIIHSFANNDIHPIFRGATNLTIEGRRPNPPSRTYFNTAKFDRETGIEGMFEHKLLFKAYDLVRYTKWLIMEQEKFSTPMDPIDQIKLIGVCNATLSTYTDSTYHSLENYVVCPRGGRYMHRALTSGFNPKTGDLSSNLYSSMYEISGTDALITRTGGSDNNLNLQYLMICIKVGLAIIRASSQELVGLNINNDILQNLKDVSFSLKDLGANMIQYTPSNQFTLATEKIKGRGKLYFNYSNWISKDEDLKEKFIYDALSCKQEIIDQECAFRQVQQYMEDQMLVSPDLISDDVFNELIKSMSYKISRHTFFDKFYRYYKSMNIIGNEGPSRAIMRSLLYTELFNAELGTSGQSWTSEIATQGYSISYKKALMRLFIIATSLIYSVDRRANGRVRLNIKTNKTLLNTHSKYKKIRNNKCHLHLRDKRITEILLHSFPLLGYTHKEIAEICEELCAEIHGKEYEQLMINEYYKKFIRQECGKNEDYDYGKVEYSRIEISPGDLADRNGLISAILLFEMACQAIVSPKNLSSPTMSAVYPSALGLLDILKSSGFIKEDDKIIELCGGRGDFHQAMIERDINHETLSREDGYNLIYNIPGMTSKKMSFNCFKAEDYMGYLHNDIILMDISHIKAPEGSLNSLMGDLQQLRKKLILRLNGTAKFFNAHVLDTMINSFVECLIPETDSPGYIYLAIDFGRKSNLRMTELKQRGYNRSLLTTKLSNAAKTTSIEDCITNLGYKTQDQTHEVISDDKLIEMLLEPEPTYVQVHPDLKENLTSKEDIETYLYCSLPDDVANKYKDYIISPHSRRITQGDSHIDTIIEYGKADMKSQPGDLVKVSAWLTGQFKIIKGLSKIPRDDLLMFVTDIRKHGNSELTALCWMMIHEFSSNMKEITSSHICELINVQKIQAKKTRIINNIYEIANQAVLSYKSFTIEKGLLMAAGMDSLSRKNIMKFKSKTVRNSVLYYRLIMNRILYLSKTIDISEMWPGIDEEERERLWNLRAEISMGNEEDENFRKISAYERIKDYLATVKDDDLFGMFTKNISLSAESVIKECKIVNDTEFGNTIVDTLLKGDDEDIEKNRNQTPAGVLEEMGFNALDDEMDEFE